MASFNDKRRGTDRTRHIHVSSMLKSRQPSEAELIAGEILEERREKTATTRARKKAEKEARLRPRKFSWEN